MPLKKNCRLVNSRSTFRISKFLALGALLLGPILLASSLYAQQQATPHRIGYLTNAAAIGPIEEAFRSGLRDLGYAEGKNLIIDWRFSSGKLDRLPNLAAELVGLNVNCIVAYGVNPTRAAKQATSTIPIVMGNADDDPVLQGLVVSLAKPGGNVTGFISIGSELAGKRLELLKEAVPKATRVAILWDPKGRGGAGHARETKTTAPALAVKLQPVEVQSIDDLERAFQTALDGRAEALMIVHPGLIQTQRTRIVNLVLKTRLPAMYTDSQFALAGGLMSYSDNDLDRSRRVATYVDKILKGTKPADLPVQRPSKFEFIINLQAAKQIGLTIPQWTLVKADKVIK